MVRPDHYGTGQASYRNKVDLTKGCSVCKEKEFFRITVHHIDGDRTNNVIENLEVVCWNCHAVRHLIYSNGEWRWNSMSLTPRDIVEDFDVKTRKRLGLE